MGEMTHKGSRKFLLGERKKNLKEQRKYSVEAQVNRKYPPTYIWQFDADNMVPVENSKMMVEALRKNQIVYKYETFPGTIHGAGEGIGTSSEGWLERAILFWKMCKLHNE